MVALSCLPSFPALELHVVTYSVPCPSLWTMPCLPLSTSSRMAAQEQTSSCYPPPVLVFLGDHESLVARGQKLSLPSTCARSSPQRGAIDRNTTIVTRLGKASARPGGTVETACASYSYSEPINTLDDITIHPHGCVSQQV